MHALAELGWAALLLTGLYIGYRGVKDVVKDWRLRRRTGAYDGHDDL